MNPGLIYVRDIRNKKFKLYLSNRFLSSTNISIYDTFTSQHEIHIENMDDYEHLYMTSFDLRFKCDGLDTEDLDMIFDILETNPNAISLSIYMINDLGKRTIHGFTKIHTRSHPIGYITEINLYFELPAWENELIGAGG